MRGKVFFAENNIGVKLSFTRLSLKKALENINRKNVDNEFTFIDYIRVKKPKVIKDFIANFIADKKIENTDLYNLTDKEIIDIFDLTIEFFNIKSTNNFNQDYDSENEYFEDYDTDNDPEYVPSSSPEIKEEDIIETYNEDLCNESIEDNNSNEQLEDNNSNEQLEENINKNDNIIEESTYKPKSKFFLVKEYLIIYSSAFILYNIYKYLKNNNYLSN